MASTYAGDDVASPGMHIGNFACMYEIASGFLVDKNRQYGEVLVESDAAGAEIASYVHANDLLSIENATTGSESFYLVDGQLSTRALTDALGDVTDTYTYEAFGNELGSSGASDNAYRYAGEQLEGDFGGYYLRERYYTARLGRFQSRDIWLGVAQLPQTLHGFAYTENNPVNFNDPTGRYTMVELMVVTGIAGVLAADTYCRYSPDITKPEERALIVFLGGTLGAFSGGLLYYGAAWVGALGAGSTAGTTTRPWFNWSRADHIFREKVGHINPQTQYTRSRFARLFEGVASNTANRRPDLMARDPNAIAASIQKFTQTFQGGQVWVDTRWAEIIDAGINRGTYR